MPRVDRVRSAPAPASALLLACGLTGTLLAAACYRDTRDPFAAREEPPLRPSGLAAESRALCPLIGPRTASPGVYGTDLGYTVKAAGSDALAVLFGDTWARPSAGCHHPVAPNDDLQAFLPRERPALLRALPSRDGKVKGCGLLRYSPSDVGDVTSWPKIRLFESEAKLRTGQALPSGLLRTPVGAFSDGRRTYGIFYRGDAVRCRGPTDCPEGMACSTEPGSFGRGIGECTQGAALLDAAPLSCRDGGDCPSGESCRPLERGVCLSLAPFVLPGGRAAPGWYVADPRRAIARAMLIGAALSPERPAAYVVVQELRTNRFQNVAARTVAHFDPVDPTRSDYRPGHHTLLVWGRPAFVEQGGAQSLPFLLFAPLDELRRTGRLRPRFFAGYAADGTVSWSPRESDALPVYGSETRAPAAPGRRIRWEEPELDYVNQMSVTFVEPLGRWVMLYGGDAAAFLVTPPAGGYAAHPVHLAPSPGAVHLRVAAHPFGRSTRGAPPSEAWSSPEPALTRTQAATFLACGEGGPAELPGCDERPDPDGPAQMVAGLGRLAGDPGAQSVLATTGRCLAGEVVMAAQAELSGSPMGRLYAPNVIEEWTEDVTARTSGVGPGERAATIYWNVSTWSPYQVVLVRTVLRGLPGGPGSSPR